MPHAKESQQNLVHNGTINKITKLFCLLKSKQNLQTHCFMNNFVCIKFIKEYNKVVYYSTVINGNEDQVSMYERFISKHSILNKEKLIHILTWLKEIGNRYGALPHLFRHEKEAAALPPPGVNREPCYIEEDNTASNNLRLYCHRLNEHVVILFDGNVKTTDQAQDCPQVATHFNFANTLALVIDNALREGDIEWDDDYMDIIYEQNLKIVF